MFAPRVAKPNAKTAAPSKNTSPLHPATPFGHRHNDGGEYLHMLQQSIGNQAVLRLLQRQGLLENKHGTPGQDISPESLSAEGGSRSLAWDFSKIPLFSPKRMSGEFQSSSQFPAPRLPEPIQTKLKVGTIDDPLEHEADRVVEQVMRMPSPESALTSAAPQVSRKCAECEEEVKLYKKGATAEAAVGEAPASVHEVLRSPGQPLDPATRGFMEPRFDWDFSGVRVHTDSAAAQSARDVNAHAYTAGHNVVFGSGQFAPGTNEGQKLLAHELTHVVQQSRSQLPITTAPRPGLVQRQKDDVKQAARAKIEEAMKKLKAKFGLAEVTEENGATWNESELVKVDAAFSKVSKEDQPLLKDLHLVRTDKFEPFVQRGETFKIAGKTFGIGTIKLAREAFQGDASTILHEVGHLIQNKVASGMLEKSKAMLDLKAAKLMMEERGKKLLLRRAKRCKHLSYHST